MTRLTTNEVETFWIRVYLGTSNELLKASIKRAYRDFSRTLHGIRKKQTPESYRLLEMTMEALVKDICAVSLSSQDDFDRWHRKGCEKLKLAFKNKVGQELFIGQAQKWINMTLKYLFALGGRIKGIDRNYKYFHIPVDEIIQRKLKENGLARFEVAWSRVDKYEDYLKYQKSVREMFKGEIPMDVEFRLYNASE